MKLENGNVGRSHQGIKACLKHILFFLLMVFLCLGVKIISEYLPQQAIMENLKVSYPGLKQRAEYGRLPISIYAYDKIDYASEGWYLNSIYYDNPSPANQALTNTVYTKIGDPTEPEVKLLQAIEGVETSTIERSVYWWGSTSVLRFFLTFVTYDQAAEFLQYLFWLLLTILACCIFHKYKWVYGFAFLFAMWNVNAHAIPMAYSFGMVYIVALAVSIYVIARFKRLSQVVPIMVCAGVLTAFFDWLSTPVITFVLPMILVFVTIYKTNLLRSFKDGIKMFLKSGVAWGLSYVGMILSKWLIVGVVLQENILKNGVERISDDSIAAGQTLSDSIRTIILAIYQNIAYLSTLRILYYIGYAAIAVVGLLLLASMGYLFLRYHKQKDRLQLSAMVLFVAMTTLIWYIVLPNHELIHAAFAYRALAGLVFGIILAFYEAIEWNKVKQNLINKKVK